MILRVCVISNRFCFGGNICLKIRNLREESIFDCKDRTKHEDARRPRFMCATAWSLRKRKYRFP